MVQESWQQTRREALAAFEAALGKAKAQDATNRAAGVAEITGNEHQESLLERLLDMASRMRALSDHGTGLDVSERGMKDPRTQGAVQKAYNGILNDLGGKSTDIAAVMALAAEAAADARVKERGVEPLHSQVAQAFIALGAPLPDSIAAERFQATGAAVAGAAAAAARPVVESTARNAALAGSAASAAWAQATRVVDQMRDNAAFESTAREELKGLVDAAGNVVQPKELKALLTRVARVNKGGQAAALINSGTSLDGLGLNEIIGVLSTDRKGAGTAERAAIDAAVKTASDEIHFAKGAKAEEARRAAAAAASTRATLVADAATLVETETSYYSGATVVTDAGREGALELAREAAIAAELGRRGYRLHDGSFERDGLPPGLEEINEVTVRVNAELARRFDTPILPLEEVTESVAGAGAGDARAEANVRGVVTEGVRAVHAQTVAEVRKLFSAQKNAAGADVQIQDADDVRKGDRTPHTLMAQSDVQRAEDLLRDGVLLRQGFAPDGKGRMSKGGKLPTAEETAAAVAEARTFIAASTVQGGGESGVSLERFSSYVADDLTTSRSATERKAVLEAHETKRDTRVIADLATQVGSGLDGLSSRIKSVTGAAVAGVAGAPTVLKTEEKREVTARGFIPPEEARRERAVGEEVHAMSGWLAATRGTPVTDATREAAAIRLEWAENDRERNPRIQASTFNPLGRTEVRPVVEGNRVGTIDISTGSGRKGDSDNMTLEVEELGGGSFRVLRAANAYTDARFPHQEEGSVIITERQLKNPTLLAAMTRLGSEVGNSQRMAGIEHRQRIELTRDLNRLDAEPGKAGLRQVAAAAKAGLDLIGDSHAPDREFEREQYFNARMKHWEGEIEAGRVAVTRESVEADALEVRTKGRSSTVALFSAVQHGEIKRLDQEAERARFTDGVKSKLERLSDAEIYDIRLRTQVAKDVKAAQEMDTGSSLSGLQMMYGVPSYKEAFERAYDAAKKEKPFAPGAESRDALIASTVGELRGTHGKGGNMDSLVGIGSHAYSEQAPLKELDRLVADKDRNEGKGFAARGGAALGSPAAREEAAFVTQLRENLQKAAYTPGQLTARYSNACEKLGKEVKSGTVATAEMVVEAMRELHRGHEKAHAQLLASVIASDAQVKTAPSVAAAKPRTPSEIIRENGTKTKAERVWLYGKIKPTTERAVHNNDPIKDPTDLTIISTKDSKVKAVGLAARTGRVGLVAGDIPEGLAVTTRHETVLLMTQEQVNAMTVKKTKTTVINTDDQAKTQSTGRGPGVEFTVDGKKFTVAGEMNEIRIMVVDKDTLQGISAGNGVNLDTKAQGKKTRLSEAPSMTVEELEKARAKQLAPALGAALGVAAVPMGEELAPAAGGGKGPATSKKTR